MSIEDVAGEAAGVDRRWNQWIGIYIAVLAVALSITSVGGNNAAKDAAKANLDATNNWAFFQAKNNRRQQYRFAVEELRMKQLEHAAMSGELKTAIANRIKSHEAEIAKLTSDPKGKEGLDELWQKGKALEQVRDAALKKDPYFDYAEAFLQIAIVLASIAIVTGGASALVLSILIGAGGALFAANGFLMFVNLW